jgi:3'-phosphoadenosine 5'-phosphosulfate sulfotransferase (PAPS reductase)/FAD synthetase
MTDNKKKVRHVLGLSGGKDSAALAIYMRDKIADMEYFFSDTGSEIPETYDYLDRLEAYLGKPIKRLGSKRGFEFLLRNLYNDFLPSPNARWCTREMKIKPFEEFIGNDDAFTYIGIRADENREGYISTKPNIHAVFPFKNDGLVKSDIIRILKESGVGIPKYYEWRSRSGCYFCFFQRKVEWVGLFENHRDLFEKAKTFEKVDSNTGKRFTWSEGETLEELVNRASQIKQEAAKKKNRAQNASWQEILGGSEDDDIEDRACLICSL